MSAVRVRAQGLVDGRPFRAQAIIPAEAVRGVVLGWTEGIHATRLDVTEEVLGD